MENTLQMCNLAAVAAPIGAAIAAPNQQTIVSRPDPVYVSHSYWRTVWFQLRHDPVAIVAAVVLILIAMAAVSAPWLAPSDPYKASMLKRLLPLGSAGHWLGTDELGRDMVTRLMYGGLLSLVMGVVPVLAAFAIGTTIGLFAG